MTLQLDSVFDDIFGNSLVDQVTDFFRQIDLGEIDLGDFFGDISLDGLADELVDGLDLFFSDFNLVNLFRSVDSTLGGVDLQGIDFDGLLKGFVGDLSVNRVLEDLGSLVGDVNVDALFEDRDDVSNDSLSRFVSQVRDITGDVFDDVLTGASNILSGDRTANLLKGTRVSNFLSGYSGKDFLSGLGGDDILLGDRGQDSLFGGQGSDILFGGIGKNLLSGGRGNDIFALATGAGHALVTDFQAGQDAIALVGDLAFGDLNLTQQGVNLLIHNGDDLLAVLQQVGSTALSVADFVST